VLALRCLWYGALDGQLVQVILSRAVGAPDGYQLALVTTDLAAFGVFMRTRIARYSRPTASIELMTRLRGS
jgi:hypothetical protein